MQALVAKDMASANPQIIVLPAVLHTLAGPQGDTVVLDTQKDMICIGHAHYLDPDLLAAFVHFLLILRRYHHQGEVICPRKVHDVVGAEVLVIAVMTTAVIVTEVEVGAEAEVAISGTEEIVHFLWQSSYLDSYHISTCIG